MDSQRFHRPVIITRHAQERMAQRGISQADLLAVIDTGNVRYRDATHLWAFKSFPVRRDNLLCAVLVLENAVVVKTVMHHFEIKESSMKTTYFDEDDTLVIRLSDKPIVREVSQDWNTHISYAEDGSTVELVVLEARARGIMPMEVCHAAAH